MATTGLSTSEEAELVFVSEGDIFSSSNGVCGKIPDSGMTVSVLRWVSEWGKGYISMKRKESFRAGCKDDSHSLVVRNESPTPWGCR